jgi:hypothetical protein
MVSVPIFPLISATVVAAALLLAPQLAMGETVSTIRYTIAFDRNDLVYRSLGEYDIIEWEGCDFLRETGKPLLPVRTIRIALPHGTAAVGVGVVEAKTELLGGDYFIFPAQAPLPVGPGGANAFLEHDPETYASREPYPAEITGSLTRTDLAGQPLATIPLCPFRYIPAERRLAFCSFITIEIRLADAACGDYLPTAMSAAGRRSYEKMLKEMVMNPGDVLLRIDDDVPRTGAGDSPLLSLPPARYDYVIVTQGDWADDFQPLADWKTKKGVPAAIVTTEWIYGEYPGSTDQEKIRNFVQEAHSAWGTLYFLLGGDTNIVPAQTKQIGEVLIPGDTYYADFDDDWTCEVHVGRAAVRVPDAWGIETFIGKILTYEKNPPAAGYATSAAFFGFDLSGEGSNEGEGCKRAVDSFYIPPEWALTLEYDSDKDAHLEDVLRDLDQGSHLVDHIDHSNVDMMGAGYMNHDGMIFTSHAKSRTNGDRQSVIYSMGCGPCNYTIEECIAEGFVRNPGGGAVAFIGNSDLGWYVPGTVDGYSLRYDRWFFRSLFEQDHHVLGECFSDHKNDAYQEDYYYQYIFYELTLLGDPELPLWTMEPGVLDVSHPMTIPKGTPSSFTVQVAQAGNPMEGALACLWKGDEVYLTGSTDAAGNVTFLPEPATPGSMSVTVTLDNYLPYEGAAVVTAGHPRYATPSQLP